MALEMKALHQNGTWELVPLPPSKKIVGCKWVYTVKFNSDGSVERLKARLVAEGPRHMVLIMMRSFLQLPKSLLSVLLFLWLLILIGPYFNWMSKMPFYMGFT
jgi:hypothetical protein